MYVCGYIKYKHHVYDMPVCVCSGGYDFAADIIHDLRAKMSHHKPVFVKFREVFFLFLLHIDIRCSLIISAINTCLILLLTLKLIQP